MTNFKVLLQKKKKKKKKEANGKVDKGKTDRQGKNCISTPNLLILGENISMDNHNSKVLLYIKGYLDNWLLYLAPFW